MDGEAEKGAAKARLVMVHSGSLLSYVVTFSLSG